MSRHYAAAGVNLDTAERAKSRIAELVRRTRTPLALGELGAFGGMVRVPPGYRKPVLVGPVVVALALAGASGVEPTAGSGRVAGSDWAGGAWSRRASSGFTAVLIVFLSFSCRLRGAQAGLGPPVFEYPLRMTAMQTSGSRPSGERIEATHV